MPVSCIFLVSARRFKCIWHNAKHESYRAFNAICGRLGRPASRHVVLHLVRSKRIAVLPYGLDACPNQYYEFQVAAGSDH